MRKEDRNWGRGGLEGGGGRRQRDGRRWEGDGMEGRRREAGLDKRVETKRKTWEGRVKKKPRVRSRRETDSIRLDVVRVRARPLFFVFQR